MAFIHYPLMTISDFEEMIQLWKNTPGLGLSNADRIEAIESFLARNPGMSYTARDDGRLVGTVLTGHDGRRGYLYHVAVEAAYRRQGIAGKLVELSLQALRAEGIDKCHLFVMAGNESGQAFWGAAGWVRRGDVVIFSHDLCR